MVLGCMTSEDTQQSVKCQACFKNTNLDDLISGTPTKCC